MTSDERCCPGHGTMAHVRGCVYHPEYPGRRGQIEPLRACSAPLPSGDASPTDDD